jgi:phosphoribosylamine--glycine ligase
MLGDNRWACSQRGSRVVIEEFLPARKPASSSWSTARTCWRWPPARTTSACGDGDTGPNTGGMGAYSPAPVVTPNVHAKVMREIILPTVQAWRRDGIPFTGFLYAGLMIDAHGRPRRWSSTAAWATRKPSRS